VIQPSGPIGNVPRSIMINFRVPDLGTAIRELQAKGIQIEKTVEPTRPGRK
jgi:hypothetical protein